MTADRIVEGWEVFERWAKRFRATAREDRYAFCLSKANDIVGSFDGRLAEPSDFEQPSDVDRRVRDRIAFLRDYLLDISFDGGDFHATVKKLLACQAPRACPKCYAIWVCVNESEAVLQGNRVNGQLGNVGANILHR
jgi:hypothetical protein